MPANASPLATQTTPRHTAVIRDALINRTLMVTLAVPSRHPVRRRSDRPFVAANGGRSRDACLDMTRRCKMGKRTDPGKGEKVAELRCDLTVRESDTNGRVVRVGDVRRVVRVEDGEKG
jgi:hypothetical protein